MPRASSGPGLRSLFERKPLRAASAETVASGYRRTLGSWDLVSLGVAAIVGAGIFAGIGAAARDAGPGVIVSYVIAGIACIFAALAYAELASLLPQSGSAYAYAAVSLGRLPAFLTAWFLILEYAVGNMFVAISWSGYLNAGLDGLGLGLPRTLRASVIEAAGSGVDLGAAIITMLVALLVAVGIRESLRVGHALVVFKLLIVLFFVAVGIAFVRPSNFEPFFPGGASGVQSAAAAAFFAYIGFDAVSTTAEEARHPRRDLPVGIVGSLLISMVLYVVVAFVLTGMASYETLDNDAPLARAFEAAGFGFASGLVIVGALVATTTVLIAFTIGLPRIFHAVARDGFLPARFTRIHPRFKTPFALTLVGGAVAAVGAAIIPTRIVLDLTVLGTLAIFILCCVGVLVLKRLEPTAPRRFRVHWSFPALGIVFCIYLALGVGLLVHLVFIGWVGAGLMLYGFYAHRRGMRSSQNPGR